jgi:uncharacterized RDD family membrane protein YckC
MDSVKKRRFLAAFIDLFVIPSIFFFVLGYVNQGPAPIYVAIIINITWLSVRDIFNGAGPGKRLCKVRVIRVDTGEALQPNDFLIGFLRNILMAIPFVLVFGFFIETIILFATGERLGDKWAKTRVVTSE